MFRNPRTFAFVLAVFSSPVFGASLDYAQINKTLSAIAAEVIEAAQVQDASGKDLLGSLNLQIDEKATDLDKGNLDVSASLSVLSTRWAPGKASSIAARVETKLAEVNGTEEMHVIASLSTKTDVLKLAKYVIAEMKKSSDPCSEANIQSKSFDKDEQEYLEDVCQERDDLETAKDMGVFLDGMEAIVKKRLAYLKKFEIELPELSEKKALTALLKAFENRTDKKSLKLTWNEQLQIVDGTKTTALILNVNDSLLEVAVEGVSIEGAVAFNNVKKELQEFAMKLSLEDGDPEKKAFNEQIRKSLAEFVGFAVELIIAK